MRRGLALVLVILFAAAPAPASFNRLQIDMGRGRAVVWSRGRSPVLLVYPDRGDGWIALARRYCSGAADARRLRRANPRLRHPVAGARVRIPVELLRGSWRLRAVSRLFPTDRRVRGGWRHRVLDPFGDAGESWEWLARLLSGDARNAGLLRRSNPELGSRRPRRGELVFVPEAALLPAFRSLPVAVETEKAPGPSPAPAATPGSGPRAATGKGGGDSRTVPLAYGRDRSGEYAIYRLRAGEALYSAVVVRFTGQLHAAEVNATAARIARRSGIRDVTSIPVGYPVKIPLDLLLPEYLPPGNPRRVAWESRRRELRKFVEVVHAAQLAGVRVILDAGHGGNDTGAVSHGTWESTYAYDLMCRMKADLERYTRARVWTTIEDRSRGFTVPNRDVLVQDRDQFLLTHPRFFLTDSATGVHLRWYLTNDIVLRERKRGVPAAKIVFLSIHADSLFRTVRGAMAYVPSRYLRPRSFSVGRSVMNGFREYRRHPRVVLSRRFKARAEASSRRLARKIIGSLHRSRIEVHPYAPVRGSVLRGRRRWVPAVLRYSLAQNAVLVECCNLANPEDRKLLLDHRWRERFARAVVQGVAEAFDGR